jgi:SAM-dependent methyltransferase
MENQSAGENKLPDHAFWEKSFATERTGWDRGGVHPALTDWLQAEALLPCRIAVPGCGNGYEVITLAENGFDVTAIDFVQQPLNRLKQKLHGFKSNSAIVHSDIFDFSPVTKFDAIYEQTCLCAIPPANRVAYERLVFEWLRPHGNLFILFMQTGVDRSPPFHCDLAEMKTLFHEDRWIWKQDERHQYEHPSGVGIETAVQLERKATGD